MEPAERIVHDVLRGLPVTSHDQGEPGQPERVRGVERGDGRPGIRRAPRAAGPGGHGGTADRSWWVRIHTTEIPIGLKGCLLANNFSAPMTRLRRAYGAL